MTENEKRAIALLRDIVNEMDATKGHYFRCLQPHYDCVVNATEFIRKLDSAESTPKEPHG